MVFEAVKVALDPTPAQERLLLSHTGAARFAFNAGLAHVKAGIDTGAKPEWSYYALVRWWNANKDALAVDADGTPWWAENSKEAANTGLRSLAAALSNWSKSRRGERRGRKVGFPKFKAKSKAAPRFAYTTGAFGLIQGDPKALKLPKVGRVHCMEDVAERVGGARVLRMTDADPAPVTAWAEAVGRASKAEKRVLERRNIEHHGVLVDGDGTICGYTESAPSVDELGRVTWDSYTLTPETCTAAGVPPTRRVSVGRGYWFSHPNLADGKTLAHVTFPEVGLGSARDEQERIKR